MRKEGDIIFYPPDRIELYLRKNYSEHVHGYRMGWLEIEKFRAFGRDCYHIYSKNDGNKKIVGTVI